MFEKINEIKASKWMKTLTEEQLDKQVVLRDNWSDAIVDGKLRSMIKNGWIKPEDNIDIDKTDIVNGNSVYFGTVPTKYIDADKLWTNRPIVPDGKSQDYIAGFMECMWAFREIIQKNTTADVVLKSEVEKLELTLEEVMLSVDKWLDERDYDADPVKRAITMREKTLKIVENLRAEVAQEIFEKIERTLDNYHSACLPIGAIEAYSYYEGGLEEAIAELKNEYVEDEE